MWLGEDVESSTMRRFAGAWRRNRVFSVRRVGKDCPVTPDATVQDSSPLISIVIRYTAVTHNIQYTIHVDGMSADVQRRRFLGNFNIFAG